MCALVLVHYMSTRVAITADYTVTYCVWGPTGEIHMGGQEHFYLETNCTLAVPRGEDGEMELFVSTQSATKTQVSYDWLAEHQSIRTLEPD